MKPTFSEHDTDPGIDDRATSIPLEELGISAQTNDNDDQVTAGGDDRPPVVLREAQPRRWLSKDTNAKIACAGLLLALTLGTGAWIGQNLNNKWAKKSYDLGLKVACQDHPVSTILEPLRQGALTHILQEWQDSNDCSTFEIAPGYSPTGWSAWSKASQLYFDCRISAAGFLSCLWRWSQDQCIYILRLPVSVNASVVVPALICFVLYELIVARCMSGKCWLLEYTVAAILGCSVALMYLVSVK